MKRYWRVVRTWETALGLLAPEERRNPHARKNLQTLFSMLAKEPGNAYFVTLLCTLCGETHQTMMFLRELSGVYKQKFDADEMMTALCEKCSNRAKELIAHGVTDPKEINAALKAAAKADKLPRAS